MAIGRTNAGGGGTPINFNVVGGTTRPTSPKENTIWVKTNLAVSCWELNGITWIPTWDAAAGYVYIQVESGYWTGAEAWATDTNFYATNKNNIFTCLKLVGCMQNQDGTGSGWKKMEAYIYKSGNWIQFSDENDGYLYRQGNLCTNNGGNWLTAGIGMNEDSPSPQAPGFTNGTTSATITQAANKGGIVYKANKIDLTDATQIVFTGNHSISGSPHYLAIAVWSALPTSTQYWSQNRVAKADFGNTQGAVSASLDVSALSGEYYVGICIFGARTLEMSTMQLVE